MTVHNAKERPRTEQSDPDPAPDESMVNIGVKVPRALKEELERIKSTLDDRSVSFVARKLIVMGLETYYRTKRLDKQPCDNEPPAHENPVVETESAARHALGSSRGKVRK